jgi:hypothetical protein
LFLARAREKLLIEFWTKLRTAVEALPADVLWSRSDEQSNSVGNLLLHLNGNVRQWIISGVAGAPDVRQRSAEFAARSGAPASQLLAELEKTLGEADQILARLSDGDLVQRRTIQGREGTVFDAISQVVEHFSMHLGQIILLAKLHAPGAIHFYEDAGGLARPIWKDLVRPRKA